MSEALAVPPEFDDLAVEDKIDYVQSLWERIAASPEKVPVPDWHRKVIRERMEARSDLDEGASWSEVRSRVEKKLQKIR